MDDFTPDILTEGGYWSEGEIDGNRAIVRVRAGDNLIARIKRGSDVPLELIDDPDRFWTPTRRIVRPDNSFSSEVPALPLVEVIKLVPDDTRQGNIQRRAEVIAQQSDREGYVKIPNDAETNQLLALLNKLGYGLDRVSTGTFPTTSVLDNFNRGNGGLGANWSDIFAGLTINTNVVAGTNADNGAFYNPITPGPDSEVFLTISTLPGTNNVIQLWYRYDTDNTNLYLIEYTQLAGTDTVAYFRIDGGGPTQLGATINQDFAVGDASGSEVIGNTHITYRKPSGGSWGALDAGRSDNTYTTAGRIGFYMQSTTGRVDDFGGGTVVTATGKPYYAYAQQ